MGKTIELNNKLEEKELKHLQDLNSQYAKSKMALGDIKLQEMEVLEKVKQIKHLFIIEEKKLIKKYGSDAVINLQTGEITKDENG
jgi:hypothetical protein